jgi:hypothetical protein
MPFGDEVPMSDDSSRRPGQPPEAAAPERPSARIAFSIMALLTAANLVGGDS